jgi:hypothetical protein
MGLLLPEMSPDQFINWKPSLALAVTEILCPWFSHVSPGGVIVPESEGPTDVVKEHWVLKVAVYVTPQDGATRV